MQFTLFFMLHSPENVPLHGLVCEYPIIARGNFIHLIIRKHFASRTMMKRA